MGAAERVREQSSAQHRRAANGIGEPLPVERAARRRGAYGGVTPISPGAFIAIAAVDAVGARAGPWNARAEDERASIGSAEQENKISVRPDEINLGRAGGRAGR